MRITKEIREPDAYNFRMFGPKTVENDVEFRGLERSSVVSFA
ncbi:MAG: hypothetical protein ACE5K3_01325 [bacterium]